MTRERVTIDGDGRLALTASLAEALFADPERRRLVDGPAWRALEAAGVSEGDRVHARLEVAFRAAAAPAYRLTVRRDGHTARGWIDQFACALLVPRDDELVEILCMPRDFLPDALARLVELGPRPRTRSAPIELREGNAEEIGLIRKRWSIRAQAVAYQDETGELEVLDAATGLWELSDGHGRATAHPTTPSAVWLRLAGLAARPDLDPSD